MQKQAWIQTDCEAGELIGKLNDLEDAGYMPWKLLSIEMQELQDPINLRQKIRILSHLKALKK
jgi:hypothetical protein